MSIDSSAKSRAKLRESIFACAILSLFFVAFFPQAIFGGRYLLSNDAFFYSYPLRTVAWNMIRDGTLPVWTPHILSGYPLLSMAQLGLGYPLTWGYLFLPGHIAEQIYVLAPFLLAPIFTYAYLRELGRSSLASILGALTFGYGGAMASPLANNGLMPNAVMWLPLLLIALERVRRGGVVRPMLLATLAYTMSILTGYGQGFVYVGTVAFFYAGFLVVSTGDKPLSRLRSPSRWKPVFVIVAAGFVSMGVSAFQILETSLAIQQSVRKRLSYETLTQGSFSFSQFLQSVTTPLFFGHDVYAFVSPLAFGLAVLAVVAYFKTKSDPRILFWIIVAFVACVLMLGHSTPLYRIVYHIPILNRFRVPARHAFEWTFALGVLSAFGWDLAMTALQRRRDQIFNPSRLALATSLAVAAIVVGIVWWRQIVSLRAIVEIPTAAYHTFLFWKSVFVLLTTATLWQASLIAHARWRFSVLLGCILMLSYVEPSALISRWWGSINLPAERFTVISDASRFLKQFPVAENRIYTRVDLFSEQYESKPRLDSQNLSAVFGLQNVAGYEPLIFDRYSRALGSVGLDSVHRHSTYAPDESLLSADSHVLDLLNTKHLVTYTNLATSLDSASLKNALVTLQPLGEISPQTQKMFGAPPIVADSLLLVTSLSNSINEAQGNTVARIRIHRADGGIVEQEIRAGIDTAEWAHERPDVRQIIKHSLADVFDTSHVQGQNGFSAYRFRARLSLGGRTRVRNVEIENTSQISSLALYGAALVDSETEKAASLAPGYSEKWQPVHEQRETLILQNQRSLPRAWLVAEAEAVDSEEALRRIRGESNIEFDPARTALLEVTPHQLPKLPGGQPVSGSDARIRSYGSNRLTIETAAPTATILVLSEIFYPGWVAVVDGEEKPIYRTNYLLRGVALPAGNHRVEMYYRAPFARIGLVISVFSLLFIAGLMMVTSTSLPKESSLKRAVDRFRELAHARAMRLWRSRNGDILALSGIAVFFLAFFGWALFTGRYLVMSDAFYYNYPLRTIAWQMVSSGYLPLWTPHIFSGYPLLSMAQLGLAYPLTWGYSILPGYVAEEIYVLAPFLLAPIFTYLYLRQLKRSPLASLLGAMTFGYGGMMASPLAHNGLLPNAVMWLPLLLIALERARQGPMVRPILLAIFAYSMSVLTGVGQGFVYVGVLAFFYALFLVISSSTTAPQRLLLLSQWRPILVITLAGIASMGVAAFQIFESARAVQLSVRSKLTYQLFTQGSFEPKHLWRSFTTPIFYVVDMHAYVPPLAAILACIALITHLRDRGVKCDRRVFFWSAVALLSLGLMMGGATRLYQILYHIPILNLFRVPSRHTIEWTFAMGVLAAYGWDAAYPLISKWRSSKSRSNGTTIYASLALLVLAAIVGSQWWLRGRTLQQYAPGSPNSEIIYGLWKAAFVLLLLGALWRAGLSSLGRWRPVVLGVVILATCFVEPSLLINRWWSPVARPASAYAHPTEITDYLRQFPPTSNRVYTRAALMSEEGEASPRFDVPNLSGMFGQHEVAGYEPLIFQRYSRALGGVWLDGVLTADRGQPDETLVSERSRVLDLLNTTHLISYSNLAAFRHGISTSSTTPSDSWKVVYEGREAQVWRNSRALPRAWLVGEAESVSSETALSIIRGETEEHFDPRRTALLEVAPAELPQLPGGPVAPESTATITRYEPNHLTIETSAATDSLLVVSEVFFPGWEVTIDGVPGRILITNYLLRGVPLTAGQHRVEMRYAAPAARTGAIISVLTLGLIAGLAIRFRQLGGSSSKTTALDARVDLPSAADDLIPGWVATVRHWVNSVPRSLREVLIFACFLLLTALMTWPWVLHLRNAVADTGDPYVIAWTLWWDYYQTFHDPLRLFHANIFYPFQYTLAFSEHGYGIALLFFPLFAAGFRPLTVHSIATFVAFAFCGYGAFRLTRTLTGSTGAGWIAGIVFAFIPFRFQLLSHLHYIFTGWLPISLEALILFIRVRSWRRACWLALAFLMNGLTSITWMIYGLIPLALSAAVLMTRHRVHNDRALWQRGLVALGFALILMAPFLWPYYQVGKLYNLTWPTFEVVRSSPGLSDWFSITPRNHFWYGFGEGLPNVSYHLFPGLLALLLPLAALFLVPAAELEQSRKVSNPVHAKRRRWVFVLDTLILTSFVIAILGIGFNKSDISFFRGGTPDRALTILLIVSVLRLSISYPQFLKTGTNENLVEWLRSPRRGDGYWIGIVWLVVGFLTAIGTSFFINRVLNDFLLPYHSLRNPSRAAMILYLGLAVLAGLGATRLAEFLAARRQPIKTWVTYLVIIVALCCELSASPMAIVNGAVDPDALTLALKETSMRGGLVELPSISPEYSLHHAMLRSADHRHPLVNAASTFNSPISRRIDEFTSAPVVATNEFLDFLEQVPTSYIAVRHRMIPGERKKLFEDFLAEARDSGRLRLVGKYENSDELYVVTKTEPEAR